MKHDTERTFKYKKLKRRLEMPDWQVKGILESIWHLAANNAPRGDIGRLTDEEIAEGIEYDGDAKALISMLVECGWLDRSKEHRLVIHDWADHCPNFIRRRVQRNREMLIVENKEVDSKCSDKSRHGATSADLSAIVPYNPTQPNPTKDTFLTECSPEPLRASGPAATQEGVLVFPVVGKGPSEWELTTAKLAEYETTFDGMDVLPEIKKARQWILDNPERRKTPRGMPSFLSRWLTKACDQGRLLPKRGGSHAAPETDAKQATRTPEETIAFALRVIRSYPCVERDNPEREAALRACLAEKGPQGLSDGVREALATPDTLKVILREPRALWRVLQICHPDGANNATAAAK